MTTESKEVRLAAIVGWPVAHSLSPVIHEYWAARDGVAAHYIRIPAAPTREAFDKVIGGLRNAGFRGANVTLPHKEHALALADEASDVAKQIGAANMLTLYGDSIIADNSDAQGFAAAARAAAKINTDRPALVLGAGGGARAIIFALKSLLGVAEVIIANRTRTRAEALANAFGGIAADWSDRGRHAADAGIVVNTTSLGMSGEPELDFSVSALSSNTLVADIVYTPLETPLLMGARARGLSTIDGLSMLMHQAVPGYEAWLGRKAMVDEELRAVLEARLRARQPS